MSDDDDDDDVLACLTVAVVAAGVVGRRRLRRRRSCWVLAFMKKLPTTFGGYVALSADINSNDLQAYHKL